MNEVWESRLSLLAAANYYSGGRETRAQQTLLLPAFVSTSAIELCWLCWNWCVILLHRSFIIFAQVLDYALSQREISGFATMFRGVAFLSILVAVVCGFQFPAYNNNKSTRMVLSESGGTNSDREIENRDNDFLSKIPNPFRELSEMLQNFDDVFDDFFYKRMGNGEGTKARLPFLRLQTADIQYLKNWWVNAFIVDIPFPVVD